MSKVLPTGGFEWIDVEGFEWKKFANDNPKGCILEIDLEYHEDLHDSHNDYTLVPEKTEIKKNMLSTYCRKLWTCMIFLLVRL